MEFHKLQGAGNDFVLIDQRRSGTMSADLARRLADRRRGVGCDQVLVLRAPATANSIASYEIWNPDGSRAEQCGNGARCIGLYLVREGSAAGSFELDAPTRTIQLDQLDGDHFRVDMGEPAFDPQTIPIGLEPRDGLYHLRLNGDDFRFGAVSMGNPHAVIETGNVASAPVATLGEALSRHDAFPSGCNVGFACIESTGRIRLRVFERGAGETLACGSGACAAVADLRRRGLLDERVEVILPGGHLVIEWPGPGYPVRMSGPAVHVFSGRIDE